ncbi:hypothetical protein C8Q70DRAFT_484212 [Cubamyces menziesii]|nr:hypothetical protein C8Q70DRAFT_484212 [Cubamyces menziesii]
MDNLRCNRLTCRRSLTDKAVVTTCSHIFCVECANELFNASRLCPACETSLTEPDDVVVCSLHPSNDYKTSVLSGLNPAIILEICSRALSFWQYQVHQEHSFQQALYRNVTDKHAQLEKRLENVIREANGEISLLTNKLQDLERDIDTERRKTTTLQDSLKESEKEYHKLKAQYDKLKRKALLGGAVVGKDGVMPLGNQSIGMQERQEDPNARLKHGYVAGIGGAVGLDVGAVVGNMEAAGVYPANTHREPHCRSRSHRYAAQRRWDGMATAPGNWHFASRSRTAPAVQRDGPSLLPDQCGEHRTVRALGQHRRS